jgi:hypothetical protein
MMTMTMHGTKHQERERARKEWMSKGLGDGWSIRSDTDFVRVALVTRDGPARQCSVCWRKMKGRGDDAPEDLEEQQDLGDVLFDLPFLAVAVALRK